MRREFLTGLFLARGPLPHCTALYRREDSLFNGSNLYAIDSYRDVVVVMWYCSCVVVVVGVVLVLAHRLNLLNNVSPWLPIA